jgi:hypothetical protein
VQLQQAAISTLQQADTLKPQRTDILKLQRTDILKLKLKFQATFYRSSESIATQSDSMIVTTDQSSIRTKRKHTASEDTANQQIALDRLRAVATTNRVTKKIAALRISHTRHTEKTASLQAI